QRWIADDPSGVQQGEQKFRIVRLEPLEIGELADLMAHDQVQIPQRMQEPPQETLLVGADRPFEQDQDVDIRMERQVPAPVAPERQDRYRRIGWRRREEEALQQRVDTIGVPLDGRAAGGALYRVMDQLLACRVERGRGARARRAI